MTQKTHLLALTGICLSGLSANAAIALYTAWDFNEGSGTTISEYQLGGGQTWNQVTNPSADIGSTASGLISTVGGSWGAASPAANSTGSLTFTASGGLNVLDTNVSGTGLNGTGAKTFVAWINPTGLDTNGAGILSYSPRGGTSAGADLRFLLDANGDLRAEVNSGFFLYDSTSHVGQGWTMVAAIFDGNTNTSSFYIGGVGIVTPTSSGAMAINTGNTSGAAGTNAFTDIVIGGAQVDNRSFVGGIDMVAVYTGAASLAELDAIYTNGIAIPEPSTYALIGGLLALGLVIVRRRVRD